MPGDDESATNALLAGLPNSSGGPLVAKVGHQYEVVGVYEGLAYHRDNSATSSSSGKGGSGVSGGGRGGGGRRGGGGGGRRGGGRGGGGGDAGASGSGGSRGGRGQGGGGGGGGEGPLEVEKSPKGMFEVPDEDSTVPSGDGPEVVKCLAQLACDNIPHKSCVGLFATSSALLRYMDHLLPGSDRATFTDAAAWLRSGKRRHAES